MTELNRLLQRLCDAEIDFVISIDDLISAKEALGRDKDRLAAKELRAVREKSK